MLIAFCGIDGSGKTTQIYRLYRTLLKKGYDPYLTKQPTDWYRKDETVRKLLNEELPLTTCIMSELSLFSAADKLRHYREEIEPQIQNNKIVISDRYVYSAYAYFLARGLNDLDWLKYLNKTLKEPDITIYIDVAPKVAFERIIKRDGKSEKKEETNYHKLEKVAKIFKEQPWGKSNKYVVIDGSKSIEEISEEIENIVLKLLKSKGEK